MATVMVAQMVGAAGSAAGAAFEAWAFGMLANALFPPDKIRAPMPEVSGYPLQTAQRGKPIPVLFGTRRLAANIIWLGGLKRKVVDKGGKAGPSSPSYEEVTYRRSFFCAVAEGPDLVIKRVWAGKTELDTTVGTWYDGTDNSGLAVLIDATQGFRKGTTQLPVEYRHVGGMLFDNYKLGSEPTLPNFTFEVSKGDQWTQHIICGECDASYDYFVVEDDGTYVVDHGPSSSTPFSFPRAMSMEEDGTVYMGGFTEEAHLVEPVADTNLGYWNWVPYFLMDPYCVHYSETKVVMVGGEAHNTPWIPDEPYMTIYNRGVWDASTPPKLDHLGTYGAFGTPKNPKTGCFVLSTNNTLVCGPWENIKKSVTLLDQGGGTLDTWKSDDATTPDVCNKVVANTEETYAYVTCQYDALLKSIIRFNINDGPGDLVPSASVNLGDDARGCIWHEDYLYVTSVRTFWLSYTADLWKFDSGLNLVAYYDSGYAEGLDVIRPEVHGDILVMPYGKTTPFSAGDGRAAHVIRIKDIPQSGVYEMLEFSSYRFPFSELNFTTIEPWDLVAVPEIFTEADLDVNPADIIETVLTNDVYGAGYSSGDLGSASFTTVRDYCEDNNLLISVALLVQKPVMDWIDYVNAHYGGFMYTSEGKLHLGIFKNETAISPGITADDLVSEGTIPPVSVSKRPPSESVNRVELQWTNRASLYTPEVATANDEVNQNRTNRIHTKAMTLDGIQDVSMASTMVYKMLYEGLYRYSTYSFTISYKSMLYQVGDVTTLSDGDKIVNQKVRIMSIQESKDGKDLDVTAIEDLAYIYDTVTASMGVSQSSTPEKTTLTDGIVNLSEDRYEKKVYVAIAPGSVEVEGYHIYRSFDDVSYTYQGEIFVELDSGNTSATGTTTTTMPAYSNVVSRQDDTVTVDVGEFVTLVGTTGAGLFTNQKLAVVESEVIGYQDVTSLGSGIWQLSGLIRGLFNTDPVAHAASANFYTLSAVFEDEFSSESVDFLYYYKVVSMYDNLIQDISDVSAVSISVKNEAARPAPATLIRVDGSEGLGYYTGATVKIDWQLASDNSGFNLGGLNWDGSTLTQWNDAEPPYNDGTEYGESFPNDGMTAVILRIETVGGTLINELELGPTIETYTLTYADADELDSNDDVVIKIIPKTTLRDLRENRVTIHRVT